MTEPPTAAPAPLLHPAVLQDIMRSLASATLRPDIFGAVLEPTRKLFGAASVLAFLTHPGAAEPALAAACGELGHRTLGLNPACLEPAPGGADPRLVWGQELTGALPGADRLAVALPASILVPLVQEDHALGMLVVNLQEPRAPGP